jgi:hypothetical protein
MTRPRETTAGFSLIEVVVAAAVTLVLAGAIVAVCRPLHGTFRMLLEGADEQQRLRVGVGLLQYDLRMAGAGASSGPQLGSLVGYFSPIRPSREGARASLADGVGVVRTDAITVMFVPPGAPQTTIATPLDAVSSVVSVSTGPLCPEGRPACGLVAGTSVVVYDATGAYDTFSVDGVEGQRLRLDHLQQGPVSRSYRPGAMLLAVSNRVYYHDTAAHQLMLYDGLSSVAPVLDNVVGLEFEYFGEPAPPVLRRPGVDRSVTYGPSPPAVGTASEGWAAGENCTFEVVDGRHVPRLAWLGPPGSGLVRLTASQLGDGPWCPDGGNAHRFDADLLRLREVRVTLRVQTPDASLRGSLTAGPDALFVQAGTSTSESTLVPDQAIRFGVSPRNLNLDR